MVGFLRAERPQVVVTFGPDGRTGHPDHFAVGALTEIAFDRAGDALAFPEQLAQGLPAWQPARLYHTALARSVAYRIGWPHASRPDRDLVAVDADGGVPPGLRVLAVFGVLAALASWTRGPAEPAPGITATAAVGRADVQ